MRKLVYVCMTAALALPPLPWQDRPAPPIRLRAVKQCSTERTTMKVPAFKLLYGTNANRSNAFGKCVSKLAQQEMRRTGRMRPRAAGRSARQTPAAFAAKYGTGKKHANAFGNCVSQTAKAAANQQQQATTSAAGACWAERQPDPAAFKAKYGTNANKSNAFGKCVSGKVKHTP